MTPEVKTQCQVNKGCAKGIHPDSRLCGVGPGVCKHFLPWRDCEICAKLAEKPKTTGGKR